MLADSFRILLTKAFEALAMLSLLKQAEGGLKV